MKFPSPFRRAQPIEPAPALIQANEILGTVIYVFDEDGVAKPVGSTSGKTPLPIASAITITNLNVGPVTVADGADVALGAKHDAQSPWALGAHDATAVQILAAIATVLGTTGDAVEEDTSSPASLSSRIDACAHFLAELRDQVSGSHVSGNLDQIADGSTGRSVSVADASTLSTDATAPTLLIPSQASKGSKDRSLSWKWTGDQVLHLLVFADFGSGGIGLQKIFDVTLADGHVTPQQAVLMDDCYVNISGTNPALAAGNALAAFDGSLRLIEVAAYAASAPTVGALLIDYAEG